MEFILTCNEAHIKLTAYEFGLYDSSFKLKEILFTGNDVSCTALAETSLEISELACLIKTSPIIFVRHIHTVDAVLKSDDSLVANACIEAEKRLDRSLSFGVQLRSDGSVGGTVAKELSEKLTKLGFRQDMKNCEQVVSLTIVGDKVFFGVGKASDNLSKWKGGMPFYSASTKFGFVSRAEYKLKEAIECFGLDLSGRKSALDLGAAPGGWTKVLAEAGLYTVAVDPHSIDRDIIKNPLVTYRRTTAELFLAEDEGKGYDFLTNDMKMGSTDSVALTIAFRKKLRAGALGVMTLKLAESFSYKEVQSALRNLTEGGYTILGARQLYHNRSEVTIAFEKRD